MIIYYCRYATPAWSATGFPAAGFRLPPTIPGRVSRAAAQLPRPVPAAAEETRPRPDAQPGHIYLYNIFITILKQKFCFCKNICISMCHLIYRPHVVGQGQ